MIRKPVVSGTFYPTGSKKIIDFIKTNLPKKVEPENIKAAIMPHAGYVYSGRVAVETAAKIAPKGLVVAMGPNHTGRGQPFSVYPDGAWQTPLGDVEIDSQTVDVLTKDSILVKDTQAHIYEHSIEVELPILQYFFSQFKFIPIVCAVAELSIYQQVAQLIYRILKEKDSLGESLILASSDMTHYEPQAQAVRKDKYVIDAILNLDTKSLLQRVDEQNVSICGIAPVSVMLEIMKLTGIKNSHLVKYATSGEINKEYSSVVGYAGLVFN